MERLKTFTSPIPFCQRCGFSTADSRGGCCSKCGVKLETYNAVAYPPQFVEEPKPDRRDP